MTTSATPVGSIQAHRSWWRIPTYLLLFIVCALVGVGVWFYALVHATLPQLDGTVQIPGLSASVTVTRDAHGVPTIEAANLNDLFFAQGYVVAQDRLWQMDGTRRYAAGELAEILGDDLVKHDRKQRILGLREAAKKTVALSTPQVQEHFEAYARGVNTFIDSHRDRLPVEFRILGYTPRPWTPVDSALIAAQMVEDLSSTPQAALTREKILAKLGPELTADLYVNTSSHDHPPTVSRARPVQDTQDEDDDEGSDSSVARLGSSNAKADEDGKHSEVLFPQALKRELAANEFAARVNSCPSGFAVVAGFFGKPWEPCAFGASGEFGENSRFVVGSNNWVISGSHTVTGRPLLSNDMHLGHQMPNLWYEAHLKSRNFDVAGVTLPGLPYVVVGHNQRLAWGFTNVGPTIEDAYVETFNADGNYLTPEGWKQPQHRSEVIKVKGKPDVVVDVVVTRHGPIVTELEPGETRKLALRWTLHDGIRTPLFAVNSAQNWMEFQQAFSQFDAPGQNVVYADVDGNIGYHTTGKIPIRASGDGSLPEDGSTNQYEWTGYIPFDKLPSVFNPPGGILATANSRITPDKYPYSVSVEWEAPWRTERIYRVLDSGKKFSPADMLLLQTDILSEFDRFVSARFVAALDHAKNPTAKAKAATEILRGWDGRMNADSAAPTIAERAREELVRLLLEPKLGAAPSDDTKPDNGSLNWKSYNWLMDTVWIENVLVEQPKRWLPEKYASYDELLAAAVEAALSEPQTPSDPADWHWGEANRAEIQHPIFGKIPFLRRWTGPGVQPQSGSIYTVKAVSRTHGPSERLTVDLANLDHTTLNLVTGQAGNFLSPYSMDQWKAWYEGYTFPLPFSSAAVQSAKAHQLMLEPGK